MRLSSLKISQKALILVAVPLVFAVSFVAVLSGLLRNAEGEIAREAHSKFVLAESDQLLRSFMSSGEALYLYELSDSKSYLNRFNELRESIPRRIRNLRTMVRGNPKQLESLDRIEKITNPALKILGEASELIEQGESVSKLSESRQEMNNLIHELMAETQRFSKEQEKLEGVDPEASKRARDLVAGSLTGFVILAVVLAVALALWFNRDTTRRLRVLMQNTDRLAHNEPLEKPVSGSDEIAHLDNVFHKMADDLAEASRRKQELVSMVAHDLRTPLTAVQLALSLLKMRASAENMSDKSVKQLNTAEHSTRMLLNLIMDLLDIEKMEAGKMVMDKSNVVVQAVFDEAVDSVEQVALAHQVELTVDDTAAVIYADHDRLVRVVINLLGNSLKFTPKGKSVRLQAEEFPDYTEIRVIDQGRGIPPDFIDKIFDRFSQVDPTNVQEKKGSGLGLAICKAIIDGHDGEIGVTSEVGEGSTFYFRIPKKTS